MDKLMELRVFLRDLITHTAIRDFNPVEWLDQHDARISAALDEWLKTLGGTILITGTPEWGRVTIYRQPSDPDPIVDFDWYTEAIND